uniref:Protein translation factor SUI1 homolog n=1 Tax=Oryza rufipogon TaxID=4529 RepID=A0A0E0N3J3_ORYRU
PRLTKTRPFPRFPPVYKRRVVEAAGSAQNQKRGLPRGQAVPRRRLPRLSPPLRFADQDPFAEANAEDSSVGAGSKDYVHVRIQQRNGRKSLTTVQGLKKEYSYNKILKDLKKEFCCNGTVVQDPELGQVIQLQGDQRKNVATFLVQAGIVKKESIKIHGF